MNRAQLIAEMEEHSRQALERLSEYRELEQDYKRTVKALKALKGEKMTTTNGSGAKSHHKAPFGSQKEAIMVIMKANPKGLTLAQIQAKLKSEAGIEVATNSIYTSLRDEAKAVAVAGSNAKLYRI